MNWNKELNWIHDPISLLIPLPFSPKEKKFYRPIKIPGLMILPGKCFYIEANWTHKSVLRPKYVIDHETKDRKQNSTVAATVHVTSKCFQTAENARDFFNARASFGPSCLAIFFERKIFCCPRKSCDMRPTAAPSSKRCVASTFLYYNFGRKTTLKWLSQIS